MAVGTRVGVGVGMGTGVAVGSGVRVGSGRAVAVGVGDSPPHAASIVKSRAVRYRPRRTGDPSSVVTRQSRADYITTAGAARARRLPMER